MPVLFLLALVAPVHSMLVPIDLVSLIKSSDADHGMLKV